MGWAHAQGCSFSQNPMRPDHIYDSDALSPVNSRRTSSIMIFSTSCSLASHPTILTFILWWIHASKAIVKDRRRTSLMGVEKRAKRKNELQNPAWCSSIVFWISIVSNILFQATLLSWHCSRATWWPLTGLPSRRWWIRRLDASFRVFSLSQPPP
jgi:hypothetical protein